jgi:hypothetical protein
MALDFVLAHPTVQLLATESEKLGPIFLVDADLPAPRIPSFCYVDEGVLSNAGFTSFLDRYRRLFVALRRFRLIYIAAQHRNPQGHAPRGTIGEYFRLPRLLETRQYRHLDKSKLDRLRDLSRRFSHHGTETHF